MTSVKRLWYHPIAADVRLTLYGALVITGIYLLYFDRTEYICNLPGKTCPFCGLKTAVYHLLHLRFELAHQANPFVWLLVAMGGAMVVDTLFLLIHSIKKRKL